MPFWFSRYRAGIHDFTSREMKICELKIVDQGARRRNGSARSNEQSCRRSMSVRSDDLAGLDVDKDVLLALVRCLDLDHIDILAFLPLNREIGGLAGDSR
jgi:hypothetical protein